MGTPGPATSYTLQPPCGISHMEEGVVLEEAFDDQDERAMGIASEPLQRSIIKTAIPLQSPEKPCLMNSGVSQYDRLSSRRIGGQAAKSQQDRMNLTFRPAFLRILICQSLIFSR